MVIGSRSADRATPVALKLAAETGGEVAGADNLSAVALGDIVIVAVPWDGHAELLTELSRGLVGKVVVDCVNPLGFDKQGAYALDVAEGSAAASGGPSPGVDRGRRIPQRQRRAPG